MAMAKETPGRHGESSNVGLLVPRAVIGSVSAESLAQCAQCTLVRHINDAGVALRWLLRAVALRREVIYLLKDMKERKIKVEPARQTPVLAVAAREP